MGTKIHVACVDERHALGVILTPGQAGDPGCGHAFIDKLKGLRQVRACAGDRAYDTDGIRAKLSEAGIEAVIPPRIIRKVQFPYSKRRYKERNRVVRLINRLKQFRAIATRYEKLACMYLGLITAVLIALALQQ